MTSLKLTRSRKTIDIKYEIIKYFDSIEKTGRGAKAKVIAKFNLPRISSLNTILSQRNEIIRSFESNQSSTHRVRLTTSRIPYLDEKLYEKIEENGEMDDLNLIATAKEIRDELLKNCQLPAEERSKLRDPSNGGIQTFEVNRKIELNSNA